MKTTSKTIINLEPGTTANLCLATVLCHAGTKTHEGPGNCRRWKGSSLRYLIRKKIQKREIPYYDLGRPKLKVSDLDKFIETKKVKAERWPSRRAGQGEAG